MTGEQQSITVVLHSYIAQNYNLQYVCWSFVALAITVFLVSSAERMRQVTNAYAPPKSELQT